MPVLWRHLKAWLPYPSGQSSDARDMLPDGIQVLLGGVEVFTLGSAAMRRTLLPILVISVPLCICRLSASTRL